ncbi:helix-turn-helix domain-containing protein [Pseudomonas sp. A4002]|nr:MULTISPECIES: helix-turn-helix domain-containing protein [unclassified Pseudomonas]NVZ36086.1 helix-turn-helix domain-containing protein [Pseudomonas sp. A4002]NWB83085.1 helix-turn-helix domain-containing protein [Pseudomonas sp. F9001]
MVLLVQNSLYSFSTEPYSPQERFEAWREEVNAIFDINIGELQSSAFNYRLLTRYLGSLLMGCGTWNGTGEPVHYKVKRTAQMIRRDGMDHYYICLGLSHSINGSAGRTSLVAGYTQVYVLDLARELDCVITAGDTIILTIPRDMLTSRLGNKNLHGLVLQRGMSNLLADHMRALRHRLPSFDDDDIPHVQEATLAMVSAAIAPSMVNLENAEPEIDRTLLTRARHLVEQHLQNPALSPEFICRHLGVSRAQLYRIFTQHEGVAAYIQLRRLNKARLIIQSDYRAQHKISGLAFQFGFKSDAHFSRTFKKAFGYSPKDAREWAAANPPKENTSYSARQPGFSLRTILDQMKQ